jgi:DNA-binding transcriptional MerR regulator
MDQFPIRVIAELSGVAATTLRAWERRYGLLKPTRSPSGHRLYNNDDLSTVKRVVRLLDAGQPIREAAKQVKENRDELPAAGPAEHWQLMQRRLLSSLGSFDQQRLDNVYNEALSQYPFDLVSERLILPVMQELGERWRQRAAGMAEEHFLSACCWPAFPANSTRSVCCCLPWPRWVAATG